MIDEINVKEHFENVNIERDVDIQNLRQELAKKFKDYENTMKYMLADAPIGILCLDPKIEKILLDEGFLRVYDLFNIDLIKVKGLGAVRMRDLTASLDKFFSML